jgi:hypothetical protein
MSFQIRPGARGLRARLLQLAAGLVVSVAAATSPAGAEQLSTPRAPSASEQANRPVRGMSMEKVEALFGAPIQRAAPVGEPPITRWEYPGFVVYFEHHLVIHTVAIS